MAYSIDFFIIVSKYFATFFVVDKSLIYLRPNYLPQIIFIKSSILIITLSMKDSNLTEVNQVKHRPDFVESCKETHYR